MSETNLPVGRFNLAIVLLDPHVDVEGLGRGQVNGYVRPHRPHVVRQQPVVFAAKHVGRTWKMPT